MNVVTKKIALPDGRVITLETGKLAKQADGAVMATLGNTMVLATVCSAKQAVPGTDFMPLTVEYKEKFSANGRFPGGFTRREGKASDYEILIARLIDRALRPLFPSNYHAETFVNVTMYSADGVDMPESIAGLAASAALMCSDIPWEGPISEVRVARVDGKMVINPTFEECEKADIELMVAATEDNINMVEGEMKEVSEAEMLEAIKAAHEAIKPQCRAQIEMMKEFGKEVKREYCHEINDDELKQAVHDGCYEGAYKQAAAEDTDKHHREEMFTAVRESFKESYDVAAKAEQLGVSEDEVIALIDRYYHDVEKEAMRRVVLDEGKRLDGRKTDEIRPIWCEVSPLPGPHGSAIFTRGETQSLATVTLGTKRDEKMIDEALIQGSEKFLLHYNFPPFSTGEAKAQRGVGRREIGHGNLACRGLKYMIPEDFPYTVRVVSDILESNGSSSMASVCGGCLALMDAGVPMKRPVSGIAMGMISEFVDGKLNYKILSDILGDEDHLGDMDFKTTGTVKGLTATQMDLKVEGLSYEALEKALQQAHEGRMHILGKMLETLGGPREDLKPHAPRIVSFMVPKEFIGAIIGPGGKIIQGIQAETGATVSIEEIAEGGKVDVASNCKESLDAAVAKIKAIVAIPEVGEVYESTVKSIMPYGCFVEFMPGKEGLLHISEIDWKRYETMEETGIKEGDKITIKLLEVDPKTGKFRLSAKALKEKPEGYVEPERRPRPERGDRPRHEGDRGPRPERH